MKPGRARVPLVRKKQIALSGFQPLRFAFIPHRTVPQPLDAKSQELSALTSTSCHTLELAEYGSQTRTAPARRNCPRKLPRCRISRCILRIEGIGCRVAHIARLRTSNQPNRIVRTSARSGRRTALLRPLSLSMPSATRFTGSMILPRHRCYDFRNLSGVVSRVGLQAEPGDSAEIRSQNAEVRM